MQHPTRFRHLAVRSSMVLVLAAGLVACGSDDKKADSTGDTAADATTTTAAAAGADAEFCDAVVAFNDAASNSSQDTSTPDGAKGLYGEISDLWSTVAAGSPDSVAPEVATITKAIDDLNTGDDKAFSADETFTTYTKVFSADIDECGFEKVPVTATEANGEYKFTGVPDSIDAGTVSFSLKNEGAEDHVLVVVRKKDGEKRTAEELLALPEEEAPKVVDEVGGTFAPPGATGVGASDLKPGDYVYFCPIPIGGEDGPPHFTKGMFGEFTVS